MHWSNAISNPFPLYYSLVPSRPFPCGWGGWARDYSTIYATIYLASEKRAWYPLRAHAQFHQVFLVLGYLCNPLRIILWYTSGYFPCYAIPKRWRPRWRHFAVLPTSEAHKRSEQTRSSSYLHTNSLDTCTVKNACGFTACYPENLLSYLAHAHAVDTRPSFLREGLGTRLLYTSSRRKEGLVSTACACAK